MRTSIPAACTIAYMCDNANCVFWQSVCAILSADCVDPEMPCTWGAGQPPVDRHAGLLQPADLQRTRRAHRRDAALAPVGSKVSSSRSTRSFLDSHPPALAGTGLRTRAAALDPHCPCATHFPISEPSGVATVGCTPPAGDCAARNRRSNGEGAALCPDPAALPAAGRSPSRARRGAASTWAPTTTWASPTRTPTAPHAPWMLWTPTAGGPAPPAPRLVRPPTCPRAASASEERPDMHSWHLHRRCARPSDAVPSLFVPSLRWCACSCRSPCSALPRLCTGRWRSTWRCSFVQVLIQTLVP